MCGLPHELLCKLFATLLVLRVVKLQTRVNWPTVSEWQVSQPLPGCRLGMVCKRLRALFLQEVREQVLSQLRTIRYEFWSDVASKTAHAAMTTDWDDIGFSESLHMFDERIRVVAVARKHTGEVYLYVTTGNNSRRHRKTIRIAIWRIPTVGLSTTADIEESVAMECLVQLQRTFGIIMRRGYTRRVCLYFP